MMVLELLKKKKGKKGKVKLMICPPNTEKEKETSKHREEITI